MARTSLEKKSFWPARTRLILRWPLYTIMRVAEMASHPVRVRPRHGLHSSDSNEWLENGNPSHRRISDGRTDGRARGRGRDRRRRRRRRRSASPSVSRGAAPPSPVKERTAARREKRERGGHRVRLRSSLGKSDCPLFSG